MLERFVYVRELIGVSVVMWFSDRTGTSHQLVTIWMFFEKIGHSHLLRCYCVLVLFTAVAIATTL